MFSSKSEWSSKVSKSTGWTNLEVLFSAGFSTPWAWTLAKTCILNRTSIFHLSNMFLTTFNYSTWVYFSDLVLLYHLPFMYKLSNNFICIFCLIFHHFSTKSCSQSPSLMQILHLLELASFEQFVSSFFISFNDDLILLINNSNFI